MATTLEIQEGAPDDWPDIPDLNEDIDAAVVWSRLESWIATRWSERACVFVVEGPGEWVPPLIPFSVTTVEVWFDGEWVSAVAPPSPLGGYDLQEVGPFRIAGVLGADEAPPEIVLEAARRLGQFLFIAAERGFENAILAKETSEEVDAFEYASPNVAARAIQYSGAGDLLRRFRKLGAA